MLLLNVVDVVVVAGSDVIVLLLLLLSSFLLNVDKIVAVVIAATVSDVSFNCYMKLFINNQCVFLIAGGAS